MTRALTSTIRPALLLIAAAMFALMTATMPALAQEAEPGLDCPDQAEAGGTIDCTFTGMQAGSAFQWEAEFTDGSTEAGEGAADMTGSATFTVEVPETTPVGAFQVTASGTDPEGEEFEESHQGLIAPGGGDEGEGDEGGSEEGGAEEGEDDGSGDDPAFGGEDQVSPAPDGGVATGLGAEGEGTNVALAAVLAALIASAVAAGLRRETALARHR